MCDYSLGFRRIPTREGGDKLISAGFPHTITRGFVSVDDPNVAVACFPAPSLPSRTRSDARRASSSLGGSGTRWLGSDRSTKAGQTSMAEGGASPASNSRRCSTPPEVLTQKSMSTFYADEQLPGLCL